MKTKTAHNHFSRLKLMATDIFGAAIHYKPTHTKLLQNITSVIYQDKAFPKLPAYCRTSLQEFIHSRLDSIQRDHVIWLHVNKDGMPVSWEMLTTEDRANLESHFYWFETKTENRKGEKISVGSVLTTTKTVTGKIWS